MTSLVPPSSSRDDGPAWIPAGDPYISGEAMAASARVLAAGWRRNGPEVRAFEREFAAEVGAAFAVAVSSGTTALELALCALRLPPGSRVLVSGLSSAGVLLAVLRAHLRPVLMDVSKENGRPTELTIREAAQRPGAAGQPVRAMVLGHWAGYPEDVEACANAAGLSVADVIQDAQQGLGAGVAQRQVGATGTACFSFYSTTNLPIGEGGIVTTDDALTAAEIARTRLRTARLTPRGTGGHGLHAPYGVHDGGLDATLVDHKAAIGRAQLRHLPDWQRLREHWARRYDDQLADLPGVAIPARPGSSAGRHAWALYPVRLAHPRVSRDEVRAALHAAGVRTGEPWVPLHRLAVWKSASEVPTDGLPGADAYTGQLLALPIYPRLNESTAERARRAMAGALNNGAAHRADPAPS